MGTSGVRFYPERAIAPWRAVHNFGGFGDHVGYYDTEEEAVKGLNKYISSLSKIMPFRERKMLQIALKWQKDLISANLSKSDLSDKQIAGVLDVKTSVSDFISIHSRRLKNLKVN